MAMLKIAPANIDEYIFPFPSETQKKLEQIRQLIQKLAPKAKEVISYGMPAFKLNSVIVYFAGYKHHIGFYPTSTGIKNFEKEFAKYKWSKGAVQFPLDEPLPVALITKIVKFKIKEDKEKADAKKKLKNL
ncbi:MAG: DUF1801 domain-containing protein [Bacteroidetes bacterium]|jgi:uncharacterized protein YdhG (YjbR/CyaY superfamily)|nr:DUF1801 domain-containing protein [Bacteroidota bacterium]